MIRFLLLRFLPRRLVPLLALLEVFTLVRRYLAHRDRSTHRPVMPGPADTGTGRSRVRRPSSRRS